MAALGAKIIHSHVPHFIPRIRHHNPIGHNRRSLYGDYTCRDICNFLHSERMYSVGIEAVERAVNCQDFYDEDGTQ